MIMYPTFVVREHFSRVGWMVGYTGPLSNTKEFIIGENNYVTPSHSARNLGAIFYEHLTMEAQQQYFSRFFPPPAQHQQH